MSHPSNSIIAQDEQEKASRKPIQEHRKINSQAEVNRTLIPVVR